MEQARTSVPDAAAIEIEQGPDLLSSARSHPDR
jgi:hypothetical protein